MMSGQAEREINAISATADEGLSGNKWLSEGAVVFIVGQRNGEFLLVKPTESRPDTGNGEGDWQCICETSLTGEEPPVTAWRGIIEELDNRPDVLANFGQLKPLGAVDFLDNGKVLAHVFQVLWQGEKNFSGFNLPDGEMGEACWVAPEEPLPGPLRRGVFHVLTTMGEVFINNEP